MPHATFSPKLLTQAATSQAKSIATTNINQLKEGKDIN
jgi:hypothetical protein